MRRNTRSLFLGAATIVAGALQAAPSSAAEVTFERLMNAANEPQNWLMRHGSYDAHYASSLNEINRSNVGNMKLLFMASLLSNNLPAGRQMFTPLVEDGFMYVGSGWQQYTKYDVREGTPRIVWQWDAGEDQAAANAGGIIGQGLTSAALLGNNMYVSTSYPPRLIAVDVNSGEPVFDVSTRLPDVLEDQRYTAPPLPIKDMILIGNARGDGGNRGYVSAYDANNGDFRWKFITVPGPGEPGHETWPDHAWETGGGAIWSLGTYDPDLNLAYFGTGNPVPFNDPQWRPGDNLFTNSIIALDVDNGALKWYFQETPNESWDYDAVSTKVLYDINYNGQTRKVVSTVSRDGFFYTWDRADGAFMFGEPWTNVTWTAGLDPKTGMPVEFDPNVDLQDYNGAAIKYGQRETTARNLCPHYSGGPTIMNNTYDATRGLTFMHTMVSCFNIWNTRPGDPATRTLGAGAAERIGMAGGLIAAIDVSNGQIVRQVEIKYPTYSGILGTAGDILFTGSSDGRMIVYDKDSLEELWAFDTGMRTAGNAMTYAVNGKQYFAVTVGGSGVDRSGGYAELALIPRNALLVVFGL